MSTQQPVTPVAAGPHAGVERPGGGPSRAAIVFSLLAAALAGVLVGVLIAFGGDEEAGDGGAQSTDTVAPVPIEPASVESFDPVGGSGFRDDGDGAWSTQTYTTADFGRLKAGVGLVLDLGEARKVTSVTLESASTGLAVELRAGDEPPSGDVDAMAAADSATTGEGATELSGADAGAHRYWMVWVTKLAPSDGGFSATVSTPVVAGPES